MTLNTINWDIDPEIINIFGISIRYYGLLFVSGLIFSIYILKWIYKQEDIPQEHAEKLSIYGLIGILVGARLGHCLFYEASYYLSHPIEMFLPIQFGPDGKIVFTGYRGLASHGGALGIIFVVVFYCLKAKQPLLNTIDFMAIVAPLAGFFIRLANLMNSEIIGIPTTAPWGFVFLKVDNIPRHPAQLYEAILYLLIFLLMILLYKTKRQFMKNGLFFGLTLVLVFTARFFIEFIKESQVAFEENMTINMGQVLSIPYIVIGLMFMGYGLLKTDKALT